MEEKKTYWTWTFYKILLHEIAPNVFLSDDLLLEGGSWAHPANEKQCSSGRRQEMAPSHLVFPVSLMCEQVLSLGKNSFPWDMAGQGPLQRILVEE